MPYTQADSFQVGPFQVTANPSARELAEKLNRLREAVESCRLQPGVGYTINRTTGGTTLVMKAGTGGGGTLPDPYPWQVQLLVENGEFFFRVEPASTLDGITVRNLGEKIPLQTREISRVYHCVLQVTLDQNLNATDATIKAMTSQDYPGVVFPENARQTQINRILASVSPSGTLVQDVRKNMVLLLANNGGFAAKMAVEQV